VKRYGTPSAASSADAVAISVLRRLLSR
jgi:hypothetical protein